jgi:hypothetical protein
MLIDAEDGGYYTRIGSYEVPIAPSIAIAVLQPIPRPLCKREHRTWSLEGENRGQRT